MKTTTIRDLTSDNTHSVPATTRCVEYIPRLDDSRSDYRSMTADEATARGPMRLGAPAAGTMRYVESDDAGTWWLSEVIG